ncbi:hypothetical protein DBB36_16835 [Flavobacterium sp. WLB]|uniref:hypothetical protein n=1 Tax=unclassified Flavobacterium TaxID=196869 RepID=UPI0006ABB3AF|nr:MULTISPECIES: hypothetical protein [unclassified Flavobacterium]KOP39426.1 hypothetical protein AKO67_04845 [Flavobacterium sp. VMW]OWU91706.1 hypothetical protein APR43_06370 [Flavobacterium sp. NLM]PUU68831.1 hypothetical protein DBB36_16835 [Flavobacterium sp. WLB]
MKITFFSVLILLIFGSAESFAQCDVKNRVLADGSMVYYFDPAAFYTTKSKSLKINIVTDKENYFVALQPTPFPEKKIGKGIKDDLIIHLADNNAYKLTHYDTQYIKNDSVMQVLYLIDKKDLTAFSKFEAVVASINMKGTEFIRDYNFKLHKDEIVKQLACFLKEEEK